MACRSFAMASTPARSRGAWSGERPLGNDAGQFFFVIAEAVIGVADHDDLAARTDVLRQQFGVGSEFVQFAVDVERRLANSVNETERAASANRRMKRKDVVITVRIGHV